MLRASSLLVRRRMTIIVTDTSGGGQVTWFAQLWRQCRTFSLAFSPRESIIFTLSINNFHMIVTIGNLKSNYLSDLTSFILIICLNRSTSVVSSGTKSSSPHFSYPFSTIRRLSLKFLTTTVFRSLDLQTTSTSRAGLGRASFNALQTS